MSALWCVAGILACESRYLCEQKAAMETTAKEITRYLTNICIRVNDGQR